ncbi:MAG: hypothetical protein IMZ57_06915 [Acidobacteria bacterium]|nr:hypothetical protein [Acidobacteriota bacterium]
MSRHRPSLKDLMKRAMRSSAVLQKREDARPKDYVARDRAAIVYERAWRAVQTEQTRLTNQHISPMHLNTQRSEQ